MKLNQLLPVGFMHERAERRMDEHGGEINLRITNETGGSRHPKVAKCTLEARHDDWSEGIKSGTQPDDFFALDTANHIYAIDLGVILLAAQTFASKEAFGTEVIFW